MSSNNSEPMITVEVVYALAHTQSLLRVKLPQGSTAQQAVDQSKIVEKHPELAGQSLKLGIYSKAIKADTVLRDKDRVEIYRPLIADPKEVRRQRAADGKVMKKGGGSIEAE